MKEREKIIRKILTKNSKKQSTSDNSRLKIEIYRVKPSVLKILVLTLLYERTAYGYFFSHSKKGKYFSHAEKIAT